MTSIVDQKNILRRQIRERLNDMSSVERTARSERLAESLWGDKRFAQSRQIFCYVSIFEETDTHGIIRRCLREGKKVGVPRVVPESGSIEARRITTWDSDFMPGSFGILEPNPTSTDLMDPAQIECVIVPGLAFDAEGYRLGRGKGYYDRFLAGLGRRVSRIALAFECQRVDRVPREPHDEPMDLVLYA